MSTHPDTLDNNLPTEAQPEWDMPVADHFYSWSELQELVRPHIGVLTEEESAKLPAEDKSKLLEIDDPMNKVFLAHGTKSSQQALEQMALNNWIETKADYWPMDASAAFLSHELGPHDITYKTPTEEYIIGQSKRGVRFLNYAKELDAEQLDDCKQFIELLSQFAGDRVYDFVTDVIITRFSTANKDDSGFTNPDRKGVLFINADLLDSDEMAHDSSLQGGVLIGVLMHEASHLILGDSPEAKEKLREFAISIGWDIDGMESKYYGDHIPRYAPDNDAYEQGAGVPTEYGKHNPEESFAEIARYAMLSDRVALHMPKSNDAWLQLMQDRLLLPGEDPSDRPIATPIKRVPVIVEKRVGEDITYPGIDIPDQIVYINPYSKAS